jgi:hypothetical protein
MFRFTIRDLLWLTVMVGILSAWLVDHLRLVEKSARLKMDMQMSRAVDDLSAY